MSILIKNMEMPGKCGECKLFDESHSINLFAPLGWCRINGAEIFRLSKKDDCCPLVLVPEHGRLIDANELMLKIQEYLDEYDSLNADGYHDPKWCAMKEAEMVIENAPTIIPASEGEI